MKKGTLFGLSHREKRVEKINLLHFPVFTSKNFVILKLPEPRPLIQMRVNNGE